MAVWCDKDNNGRIEADEKTDNNLIWGFGESNEYPAIRCTPLAPAEWRGWWFLNRTDQPQLNQTRLERVVSLASTELARTEELPLAPFRQSASLLKLIP